MKQYLKPFICLLLPCCAGIAQTNETHGAIETEHANTHINNEERIGFLFDIGSVYFEEGDFDSAINAYERILDIDPKNPQANYILGSVYMQAKQYRKAEIVLLSLIKENPDDFRLLNNIAWLYATAENPDIRNGQKAVQYAQKAMAIAPFNHHVWSTLSEAYYVSGEYEKAYRAINQTANLAARYGKGITKEAVDNYNEQIRKCKRALDASEAFH